MVPGPSGFFSKQNGKSPPPPPSNGIFLSQNKMLEQLEVHTLPSRKLLFPCSVENHFFFFFRDLSRLTRAIS